MYLCVCASMCVFYMLSPVIILAPPPADSRALVTVTPDVPAANPTHNQCHCNQSCHSPQCSLSSSLTSQSHLSVVSSLSYRLSPCPPLTNAFPFLSPSFSHWQTHCPSFCLVSHLITHSSSFPLSALHFILHFYLNTSKPTIPSALIRLTFPPLFSHISFFLPVTCCTHPLTTIFCRLPTEINPATGRLSQNRNCIVYLSPTLTFPCTQRNDCLLFLCPSPLP